ncbi:MAG: hypothetical protein SV760_09255, partial [Halobacteria archaeon]|nr:hypothetical protein [Halobacteria archaeon]
FTRVDYLVGALLGTAAFMMLLFALLFGGFTIAIVMLAFIILAASFFWVFKQYPYTGTERPKE